MGVAIPSKSISGLVGFLQELIDEMTRPGFRACRKSIGNPHAVRVLKEWLPYIS